MLDADTVKDAASRSRRQVKAIAAGATSKSVALQRLTSSQALAPDSPNKSEKVARIGQVKRLSARSIRRTRSRMRSTAVAFIRAYDHGKDGKVDEKEFRAGLVKLLHTIAVLHPRQRMAGRWVKPPQDLVEPARTERLLAWPCSVFRSRAGDCQDAMSLNLFGKTSGKMFLGMCFAWASMFVQATCGVLSGLGPFITRDSTGATAQVLSIAGFKLGWAAILMFYSPCGCLLSNAVVAAQFLVEGGTTLLLFLMAQSGASEEEKQQGMLLAFMLMLLPVFLPVLQKVYDGVIVNLVINCCRKKFNAAAACTAMLVCILAIPAVVGKMLGCKGSFNAAKLTTTARTLVADAKRHRDAKASTVKVKRVVRRKKKDANSDDVTTVAPACGASAAMGASGKRKEEEEEGGDDGDGDDDGGGDGGGAD